jgi:hypothetical protein
MGVDLLLLHLALDCLIAPDDLPLVLHSLERLLMNFLASVTLFDRTLDDLCSGATPPNDS